MTIKSKNNHDLLWLNFANEQNLNELQLKQFKLFNQILIETNEIHNLTTITNLKSVINNHFIDSMMLSNYINLKNKKVVCDIGTGGGFPGVPLKIKFPNLKLYLIEVVKKKIDYLNMLIDKLQLDNVEVCDLDWRTFLRKTSYKIDIFCARASLRPPQLIKMFQPSSPYKDALLVYWSSQDYELSPIERNYFLEQYFYKIASKRRRLILFSQKNN